jgi:hypothetical protein
VSVADPITRGKLEDKGFFNSSVRKLRGQVLKLE